MTNEVLPVIKSLRLQEQAAANVQAKWLKDAGDFVGAHKWAFNALCSMMGRFVGRTVAEPKPHFEGRMCLIAQFVMGVQMCEQAICHGLYSQAAALLKQQLETVAAIDEFAKGTRKDGKTPNIGTEATRMSGRIYSKLNDICHVSQRDIAKGIVFQRSGTQFGANLLPVYDREMATFLYGQHIYYITQVTILSDALNQEMFGEGISDDEKLQVTLALTVLLKANIINVPDDAVGPEPDWIRGVIKDADTPGKASARARTKRR